MRSLTVSFRRGILALVLLGGFGPSCTLAQQDASAGQSAQKLPSDIHPDTLARVARPTKNDFTTEEEKQAFDRVLAFEPSIKEQKGMLEPTGVRAYMPQVAELTRKQISTIREESGLDPKWIALAALVSIREVDNKVEWQSHERSALKVLAPKVVDVVRDSQDTSGLDPKEALIIQFGREVFHQPRVSSKTFADTQRSFGARGALGITLIMGYYMSNVLVYRAYDIHMDTSAAPVVPTW
jgi:4-carboxymuconolactone decarboxylase